MSFLPAPLLILPTRSRFSTPSQARHRFLQDRIPRKLGARIATISHRLTKRAHTNFALERWRHIAPSKVPKAPRQMLKLRSPLSIRWCRKTLSPQERAHFTWRTRPRRVRSLSHFAV